MVMPAHTVYLIDRPLDPGQDSNLSAPPFGLSARLVCALPCLCQRVPPRRPGFLLDKPVCPQRPVRVARDGLCRSSCVARDREYSCAIDAWQTLFNSVFQQNPVYVNGCGTSYTEL